MKTSASDPLRIAMLDVPTGGRIGITLCPGKKDAGGDWDRDLGVDLDAVAKTGAAAVVTLVEPLELDFLRVPGLGKEVAARHMAWVHLPIEDVWIPDAAFERAWEVEGPRLHTLLRRGCTIVVHCRGGLGRAGMIAARLAIELGETPREAMARVRAVRPGAIETPAQENYVLACRPVAEGPRAGDHDVIRGRAVGAFVGLAVGDAVGTTLEFTRRDTYVHLTDMVGGGPFRLMPGEWTDDTSMALALADSLIAHSKLDESDLMKRFDDWYRGHAYSHRNECFDIGPTTSAAIRRWRETGQPIAGNPDPRTAGNGSLMRLSPVATRWWNDPAILADVARRQSVTTHAAPTTLDACSAYAEILADAIAGRTETHVFNSTRKVETEEISAIVGGSWRTKPRDEIASSGYVVHTLEAALWSVARTHDFRSAVLTAANLGDDADTTAAVAGQLAGALYGVDGIPAEWRERLAWRERIEDRAHMLFERSLA